MTYVERVHEAARQRAAQLATPAQAARRVTTLERQVAAALSSLALAEDRRRETNRRAIARRRGTNRVQSASEVKFRARVADLRVELGVVQARLAELAG